MKLIELHILQSFPVSCLNRDDVGAPKSAVFGGVTRARISGQCLKRAIRLQAKELESDRNEKLFAGARTRKLVDDLTGRLQNPPPEWRQEPVALDRANQLAKDVCHSLLSDKKRPKEKGRADKKGASQEPANSDATEPSAAKTSTLLFLSPNEIDQVAQAILQNPNAADLRKVAVDALKGRRETSARDCADIAIFGRMVANAADITLEGAGLFNHALTTHKADNDIDFWTAVDDRKAPGEDAGAANMNVAEFTSGVFYRFAALNLDLLFGPPRSGFPGGHLRHITEPDVRKCLLETFIRATLLAIPPARDNSHNSHVEVGYALGFHRCQGQPLQLINAFEIPVRSRGAGGLLPPSVRAMLLHLQKLRDDYGSLVRPALELAFGSFRPEADSEDKVIESERLTLIPTRATNTDSKSALDNFCEQLAKKAVDEFSTQASRE